MKVYVPADRNRQNNHNMSVAPAADKEFVKGDIPSEWLDADGKPATFIVEFKQGKAEVSNQLGNYLVDRGLARKTALILPGDSHA